MQLNPRGLSSVTHLFEFGQASHWLGQEEQVIATQHKVLTLNSRHFVAHLELAEMDMESGRTTEVRAMVAAVRAINSQNSLSDMREKRPYNDPATVTGELAALSKAGLQ